MDNIKIDFLHTIKSLLYKACFDKKAKISYLPNVNIILVGASSLAFQLENRDDISTEDIDIHVTGDSEKTHELSSEKTLLFILSNISKMIVENLTVIESYAKLLNYYGKYLKIDTTEFAHRVYILGINVMDIFNHYHDPNEYFPVREGIYVLKINYFYEYQLDVFFSPRNINSLRDPKISRLDFKKLIEYSIENKNNESTFFSKYFKDSTSTFTTLKLKKTYRRLNLLYKNFNVETINVNVDVRGQIPKISFKQGSSSCTVMTYRGKDLITSKNDEKYCDSNTIIGSDIDAKELSKTNNELLKCTSTTINFIANSMKNAGNRVDKINKIQNDTLDIDMQVVEKKPLQIDIDDEDLRENIMKKLAEDLTTQTNTPIKFEKVNNTVYKVIGSTDIKDKIYHTNYNGVLYTISRFVSARGSSVSTMMEYLKIYIEDKIIPINFSIIDIDDAIILFLKKYGIKFDSKKLKIDKETETYFTVRYNGDVGELRGKKFPTETYKNIIFSPRLDTYTKFELQGKFNKESVTNIFKKYKIDGTEYKYDDNIIIVNEYAIKVDYDNYKTINIDKLDSYKSITLPDIIHFWHKQSSVTTDKMKTIWLNKIMNIPTKIDPNFIEYVKLLQNACSFELPYDMTVYKTTRSVIYDGKFTTSSMEKGKIYYQYFFNSTSIDKGNKTLLRFANYMDGTIGYIIKLPKGTKFFYFGGDESRHPNTKNYEILLPYGCKFEVEDIIDNKYIKDDSNKYYGIKYYVMKYYPPSPETYTKDIDKIFVDPKSRGVIDIDGLNTDNMNTVLENLYEYIKLHVLTYIFKNVNDIDLDKKMDIFIDIFTFAGDPYDLSLYISTFYTNIKSKTNNNSFKQRLESTYRIIMEKMLLKEILLSKQLIINKYKNLLPESLPRIEDVD